MARIRTIKPEFNTSKSVSRLSDAAQLFMLKLLTEADDYGRMRWLPKKIAGNLYPYRDDIGWYEVEGFAEELVKEGILFLYEVDGERYACFPKWEIHQRVSNPSKSTIPEPKLEETEELIKPSINPNETLITSSLDTTEELLTGKGKGTGNRERDITPSVDGKTPSEPFASVSRCLTLIGEKLEGSPPTLGEIRQHLKEDDPVRLLVGAFGVEETAEMWVWTVQNWHTTPTWKSVWLKRNEIRAKSHPPKRESKLRPFTLAEAAL